MSTTLLRGGTLVQDQRLAPRDILLEDRYIQAVLPPDAAVHADRAVDVTGLYVSPGFVDIHVHGGGGADFMDGTPEAYHTASALHLRHGTTAMVPTTLAASREELLRSFAAFEQAGDGWDDGARLLGLHIEGPYLAAGQCGAQDPRYIRAAEKEEYEQFMRVCPRILRWTAAPEIPGALDFGRALRAWGILPCIGHSDADSDHVRAAIEAGYTHVTHLYSAMSTIVRRAGFRSPGIIESAYLYEALTSEVIADGCHLPGELLRMAHRFIGTKRLALVTDAMRAAGQTTGESVLGSLKDGQRVLLEDGVAKMPDRTAFAGSICTTDRLVRTMVREAGVSLPDAVEMMTATPARIIGLSNAIGRVAQGRLADLAIFDADIQIRCVCKDGILHTDSSKEAFR